MKAFKIEIRFWTDNNRKHIARDYIEAGDLAESHVAHVAIQLASGYTSGQIVGDNFTGWWTIVDDDAAERKRRSKATTPAARKWRREAGVA